MTSRHQIEGSRYEQLGYDGSNSNTYAQEQLAKNYRELVVVKLPKEKKRKEKTPRSQIQCCVSGRVKIHHIGFSQDFDKWRDPLDIVPLYEGSEVDDLKSPVLLPFSLYFELCNAIKKALNSGRKESPHVRIKMSFDKLQFTGGLKAFTSSSRTYHGTVAKGLVKSIGVTNFSIRKLENLFKTAKIIPAINQSMFVSM